jgi:hypothetical protein
VLPFPKSDSSLLLQMLGRWTSAIIARRTSPLSRTIVPPSSGIDVEGVAHKSYLQMLKELPSAREYVNAKITNSRRMWHDKEYRHNHWHERIKYVYV